MKDRLITASLYLLLALILWVSLSSVIFRLRHPWATETETLLNLHNAVLLRKVAYEDMRPRP